MAKQSGSAAAQVLDELVHQFADAVACFRELVQNSIDAGSAEVEVEFAFEAADAAAGTGPQADSEGLITAQVQDWGSGMDKEIIEERLTRLFSSAKEGDATKIGKFGIGFVSVFALNPEAVCVDTGRGGESWRVLFNRKRGFSTLRLDEALEGTRVRTLIRGTYAEFEALRDKAKRSLVHWCTHVDAELRVQGERIDKPFGLADALVCHEATSGTSQIVVGHALATEQGFYNGGITLEAGANLVSELAGVSFKVLAGDLEHTLTRDGVVKNEAYHHALARVSALVDGPLRDDLCTQLTERLRAGEDALALRPYYLALDTHVRRALDQHKRLPEALGKAIVGQAADGSWLSLEALETAARKDRLRHASSASPTALALHSESRPVVIMPGGGSPLGRICSRLNEGKPPPDVDVLWALPGAVAPEDLPPAFARMSRVMRELLDASGHKVREIELGHFKWRGSPIRERICVSLDALGKPEELDELGDLHTGLLRRKRPLVFNIDHQVVRDCLALASEEAELAAYLLIKAARLESGPIEPDQDGLWSQLCWERRCQRQPIQSPR